jgi:putative ABC transport system substrate-binding protein
MIFKADLMNKNVVAATLAIALMLAPLVAAEAQQSKPLPKIGVLRAYAPNDQLYPAFVNALRELGYVDGKTAQIEYRQGDGERLAELAQELIRINVGVIFAPNPPQAQAIRKISMTIPIVTAALGDPIKTGLATSLAHPGGNVTGLTALGSNLSGKRLELLKELVPRLTRVAVLWNPAVPDKQVEWKEMEPIAKALKLELLSVEVRTPTDFDGAFENIKRLRPQALIALGEPLLSTQRGRVIEFTNKAHVPAMFNWREAVEEGALIAYGPDISDLYRRAATYVDKILKGAKPGDLPIEEPARFDFYVNGKTAKMLGITIPNTILVRADKVIE